MWYTENTEEYESERSGNMNVNLNFEELKSSAIEKAGIVAQKAKELASIAKAKLSIRAEEEKIRKAQTEIGKLYYRDFALNEEMDDAEYLPWCDKITESEAVIAELRKVIAELQNEGVSEKDDLVEVDEDADFADGDKPE